MKDKILNYFIEYGWILLILLVVGGILWFYGYQSPSSRTIRVEEGEIYTMNVSYLNKTTTVTIYRNSDGDVKVRKSKMDSVWLNLVNFSAPNISEGIYVEMGAKNITLTDGDRMTYFVHFYEKNRDMKLQNVRVFHLLYDNGNVFVTPKVEENFVKIRG